MAYKKPPPDAKVWDDIEHMLDSEPPMTTPTKEQINQKIQELIELLLPAYAGELERDPTIDIHTHKSSMSPLEDNHQRVQIEIDVNTIIKR